MLIQHFDVVADEFFRGVGIKISAGRVRQAGDVFGRTSRRAFKQHVLDEMRDAVKLGSFSSCAGSNPHTDTYRAYVGNRFGNNSDAIRQTGPADIAKVSYGRGHL